jgi:oligosaccharide repeat unit polymerase
MVSIFAYFLYNLSHATIAYLYGRNYSDDIYEGNIMFDTFFDALGLILPSIIAFYFIVIKGKRNLFLPFILSTPIFVILFMNGTRYHLLFSFLGFIIIIKNSYDSIKKRDLIILILLPVLLFLSSNLMIQYRALGKLGTNPSEINILPENITEHNSFAKTIASIMSPEGVISRNAMMFQYFESNNHLYGKSTSFIFYFWVPRSIWPSKPHMLEYWLIREYGITGFSEGHSVSFGFPGNFYADFGYIGALIACLLLGIGIKRLETFDIYLRKSNQYSSVLVAMLYPYIFFVVRDPITSSITFILILIVYTLFGLLFKKQKYYI